MLSVHTDYTHSITVVSEIERAAEETSPSEGTRTAPLQPSTDDADTVMRDSNVPSLPAITISSARLNKVSVQPPRSSRTMPRKSQPQAVRRSPRLRARAAASAVPTGPSVTPGPSTVDPEPAVTRPGVTGVSIDPAVSSTSSRRR